MHHRHRPRARGIRGLVLVAAVTLGVLGPAAVATAAGTDPNDGSTQGIVVTVPVHSAPPSSTPTPTPSQTPWPQTTPSSAPAPDDADADSGSTGHGSGVRLSETGIGWPALALAAAALLAGALGLALRRSARRRA
ncbi:hypothetical protein VD659_14475 [Herbiconiux sp. 11R-BC]|uniref:hypothetical protein n=1 Tax=Herbiconiux sp. 11R-BC TaxID=3111637 RepID=UPI003BFE612F